MSCKIKQSDLFAVQNGQREEPSPIADYVSIPPIEMDRPWLTKDRLFSEIESWDAVCPMRKNDGLHLVAQELESADYVLKNITEQIIRFDEDGQFVVWEAFCPDWQILDVVAAHRFAANWMGRHPKDTVIVNEESRRLVWRRFFGTMWVDGEEDMEVLSFHYLHEAMADSVRCISAAQRIFENNVISPD